MAQYVIIPGDQSARTVELVKQIESVDRELVATLVREVVQFEWSGDQDDLICEVEKLFPGGAALLRVKSLQTIQEA